ncbi:MAG: hypothetical protein JWO38_5933 [Gemmataceae bacterium]|nr:hypothetical protein [Gemmataceae bacterium]
MDRHSWLERVAGELAGRGLPAGVRAHLLEELQDHLDDLTEGSTNMAADGEVTQRMGVPDVLAATAVAEYRRAVWVRRHPFLVFGVAPVPAVILGLAVYLLAFAGVGYALDTAGFEDPIHESGFEQVAATLWYSIGFVPFLALAAGYGWLAVRSQVAWGWLAASVVQVAVLAWLARTEIRLSDVPGQSQVLLGIGFPGANLRQLAQLLPPLVVGWLALRTAGRRAAVAA